MFTRKDYDAVLKAVALNTNVELKTPASSQYNCGVCEVYLDYWFSWGTHFALKLNLPVNYKYLISLICGAKLQDYYNRSTFCDKKVGTILVTVTDKQSTEIHDFLKFVLSIAEHQGPFTLYTNPNHPDHISYLYIISMKDIQEYLDNLS